MSSVWYIGDYQSKKITTNDWFRLGITVTADTEWNIWNQWSVPTASLTTAQVNYLATDRSFLTNQPDGPRQGNAFTPPGAPAVDTAALAEMRRLVAQIRAEYPVGGGGGNYATTAYVDAQVSTLKGAAPAKWDTLAEIAAELATDDDAFLALQGLVNNKLNKTDADAAYGYAPLRSYFSPKNNANVPVPGTFSSVNLTQTVPTFANVDAVATVDMKKAVTFLGGPAHTVLSDSFWINDIDKPDTPGSITVATNTDNQHFAIECASYGVGDVKVYADDIPYNEYATVHAMPYLGIFYIEINMPTKRMRRFEITIGTAAVKRIMGEKTCTFSPASAPRLRIGIFGDSWARGSLKAAGTVTGNALPEYFRLSTGADVCINGQGGTGWRRPGDNGSNFENYNGAVRRAGMVNANPDVLVYLGSVNDNAFTLAEIQQSATDTLANAAIDHPGVPVIVVGAEPVSLGEAQYDKCNTAVKNAALAAPNVVAFIDWRADKWLTGTGNVGAPAGNGNSDFYLSADGLHPEQAGDQYLGRRLAAAVGAVRVKLVVRNSKGVGAGPGSAIDFRGLTEAIAQRALQSYVDTGLATKAPTVHQHSTSDIADLAEFTQDTTAGLLKAGSGVTLTYDDAANTLTINSTATGGTTDPEIVRDTIGGALVAGSGIQILVDDAGDIITFSVTNVPMSAISGLTAALSGKEPTIAAGTTSQYYRGDKGWATLDKTAVGLGSVDNTSDSNKSVLSATKLTTARKINGVNFDGTADITVPVVASTVTRSVPYCFEMCQQAIGYSASQAFQLKRPFRLPIKPSRFRIHFCNRVQLNGTFITGTAGDLVGLRVALGKPTIDGTTGEPTGAWASPIEVMAATNVANGSIQSTPWIDPATHGLNAGDLMLLGYSFTASASSPQIAYNGGLSWQSFALSDLMSTTAVGTRANNSSWLQVIIEIEHTDANANHLLIVGNSLSGPSASGTYDNYGELGTYQQEWAMRTRNFASTIAVAGSYSAHYNAVNTKWQIFDNFNIAYVPDVILYFASSSSDIADCTSDTTHSAVKTNVINMIKAGRTKFPSARTWLTDIPPRNNFTGDNAGAATNEGYRLKHNNWLHNLPVLTEQCLNIDAVATDWANPARLRSMYTTDGVHGNRILHDSFAGAIHLGRKVT